MRRRDIGLAAAVLATALLVYGLSRGQRLPETTTGEPAAPAAAAREPAPGPGGAPALRGGAPHATPEPDAGPLPPEDAAAPDARPVRDEPPAAGNAPFTGPVPRGYVRIQGRVRAAGSGAAVPCRQLVLSCEPDGTRVQVEVAENGRFRVEVEASTGVEVGGVEIPPGRWRVHAWYPEGGEPGDLVMKGPGKMIRMRIDLVKAFSLRGIVVDEARRPLAGAQLEWSEPVPNQGRVWSRHVAFTKEDGRFEASFLEEPAQVLPAAQVGPASELRILRAGYAPRWLDAHGVPEADRGDCRVVLARGFAVSGRLLDEAGSPIAGAPVEAVYEHPFHRASVLTDDDGRYALGNLPAGALTLRALVLARDLEARWPVTLKGDRRGVDLVAAPFDLDLPLRPVAVLGMKLADLTDAARTERGFDPEVKVVVIDPGAMHARLGVGHLVPGLGIRSLGHVPVRSVKDFVVRLLEASMAAPNQRLRARIVFAYPGGGGTSTQVLTIVPEEFASLRRTARTLP